MEEDVQHSAADGKRPEPPQRVKLALTPLVQDSGVANPVHFDVELQRAEPTSSLCI